MHSRCRLMLRSLAIALALTLASTTWGCGAVHRDEGALDSVRAPEQRPVIAATDSITQGHADSTAKTASNPTLTISVQPTAVDVNGDTVRVTLSVRNLPTSSAELWMFTVDAPVPVLTVEQLGSGDKRDVDMRKEYGISVATWAFLGDHVAPGGATPPVAFSATGLPGIVSYWAERWVPPDTVETADEPPDSSQAPVKPGPWSSASDSGRTVGIVPFPADRSRAALVTRMRTLLREACAHGWVEDANVCSSLDQKLEQDDISGLLGELGANRARHVNELAYFLLVGNVSALPVK